MNDTHPWPGLTEVTEWAVRIDDKERPLGFGSGPQARQAAERFITDNSDTHRVSLVSRKTIISEWVSA